MAALPQTDQGPALPPSLRFLKWLVIALTLSMIAGVITVVALLVTRMPQALSRPLPALPGTVVLPAGTRAEAVTFAGDFVAVVVSDTDTGDQRILVFAPDGRPRGEIRLETP